MSTDAVELLDREPLKRIASRDLLFSDPWLRRALSDDPDRPPAAALVTAPQPALELHRDTRRRSAS